MRGGRENCVYATHVGVPHLVVVRGSAGIGKTDLVRRWTSNLPGAAVLWPHITPPRNAHNFWMRVITQLHARGWINDQELFAAIERAGAPDANIRDITGEVLGLVSEAPVLVIDDLHGVLDDGIYLEILGDLAAFLRGNERMRAIIVETTPSDLESIDLPKHIVVDESYLPPVAFLGEVADNRIRYRSPAPGLRTLVQDPALLRDACVAAIPHEVDAETASLLTGRDGSALLEIFARCGLGSVQTAGYATHFVFRTEVRAEAIAELRSSWPDALKVAAQQLAALAASHEHWELAFEYALLSDDAALITRVGLRVRPFPIELTPDVLEAAAAIPLAQVRANPLLSLLAAASADYLPRPDQSAIELYRHTADAAHNVRRGSSATERLVMLGIESFALRRAGNMTAAVSTAQAFGERAQSMAAEHAVDPDLAHIFANFAYQAAVTLVMGDEFAGALSLLRTLERYALANGLDASRQFALAALGFLEALSGAIPSAKALARALDTRPAPVVDRSRSYHAFVDAAAVIRAGMVGDFSALRRAVVTFRARPHEMLWDILLFGEVLLDIAGGNAGAARVRFDEAVGANLGPSTSRTTTRRASYIRAVLVLLGENPRLLSSTGSRMKDDPASLAFSAGRDIDQGDIEAASAKLSKAAAGARTPLQEHVVFTMLARLGIAENDADSTRDSASHLLVLARTHKLRIAFALLSDDERIRILESLGSPAELRAAFAVTHPLSNESVASNATILTARQLIVIRELAETGSRQEVAKRLFLSPGTVKAHLRAIYKKLDAHNEAEALYRAAALGLLQKG